MKTIKTNYEPTNNVDYQSKWVEKKQSLSTVQALYWYKVWSLRELYWSKIENILENKDISSEVLENAEQILAHWKLEEKLANMFNGLKAIEKTKALNNINKWVWTIQLWHAA